MLAQSQTRFGWGFGQWGRLLVVYVGTGGWHGGWGWDALLGWLMSVVGCESGEKATSCYVVRCYL